MYCPKCGAEYREGFSVCADCGVKLVRGEPPEELKKKPRLEYDYAEFEEIMRVINTADMAVIESILEGEGITHFFEGIPIGRLRAGLFGSRLMARKDQADLARELLKDIGLDEKEVLSADDEEKDSQ